MSKYITGKDKPDIFQYVPAPNGESKKLFDYHKIDRLGFPNNMIFSMRGKLGKTHNIKEFALDKYIENGSKSVWLYNTQEMQKDDSPKFLASNKLKNYEKWKNFELDNNLVIDKTKDKDNVFIMTKALTTFRRGSRDPRYTYLIYDEFNQGITRIVKNQMNDLLNAISTLSDDFDDTKGLQKIFLLANLDSLNLPLLAKWGITRIDEEFTFIYDDSGNPLFFIYCYIPTKEEIMSIEYEQRNNWRYQLAKMSQMDKFIFQNVSVKDNLNHIVAWEHVKDWNNKELNFAYIIDGEYLEVWNCWEEGDEMDNIIYVRWVPEKPNCKLLTIKVADINDRINMAYDVANRILHYITIGKFYYDSIFAKMTLRKIF